MSSDVVRLEYLEEGALARVTLATPKANILDMAKMARLGAILDELAGRPNLKAVILDADGPHFSFGASVEEHLPGSFETMIPTFHRLVQRIYGDPHVWLAAVRGQCLGGGLELVMLCQRIFATSDARMGQPEIQLGVFAPAASVLLPNRIGRARAEELCLTGRSLDGEGARSWGLVDELSDDPTGSAVEWFNRHLAALSAEAVRHAVMALRSGPAERLAADLARVEDLYLNRLMKTNDAREGLAAFLARRPAVWSHS